MYSGAGAAQVHRYLDVDRSTACGQTKHYFVRLLRLPLNLFCKVVDPTHSWNATTTKEHRILRGSTCRWRPLDGVYSPHSPIKPYLTIDESTSQLLEKGYLQPYIFIVCFLNIHVEFVGNLFRNSGPRGLLINMVLGGNSGLYTPSTRGHHRLHRTRNMQYSHEETLFLNHYSKIFKVYRVIRVNTCSSYTPNNIITLLGYFEVF